MLKLNFVTIQDKIYINKKNKGKINAYLYKQNNCMYILLPLINSYLIYPFFIFSKKYKILIIVIINGMKKIILLNVLVFIHDIKKEFASIS